VKNLFKAIVGRIKSYYAPHSLYSSLEQLKEDAACLTFVCPGCGFHLQILETSSVGAPAMSQPKKTVRQPKRTRLLPLIADQSDQGEQSLDMRLYSHHDILPSTPEQIAEFEESLYAAPSTHTDTLPDIRFSHTDPLPDIRFPHTDPLPDMRFSHIKTDDSRQFKIPSRSFRNF